MPSVSVSDVPVLPSPDVVSPDGPPEGHQEPPEHPAAGLAYPEGTHSELQTKMNALPVYYRTFFFPFLEIFFPHGVPHMFPNYVELKIVLGI